MNKMIKDGKVAVLVSPGFGAGWYTWNVHTPECLFDPEVVQMVLDGKDHHDIEAFAEKKYETDTYEFYGGGATTLTVEWIPQGKKFYVMEYDGSESVLLEDDLMEA